MAFPLAPGARQPGLPFARQPNGPVIVRKSNKLGMRQEAAPSLEIMIDAVAAEVPAFLIMTARV